MNAKINKTKKKQIENIVCCLDTIDVISILPLIVEPKNQAKL